MMIRDGYYLSIYITPPGLAAELDVWLRHDANASLWRIDGDSAELLAHWELERLTGVKHEGRGPSSAREFSREMEALLAEFDLTWDDIEATWGTPGIDKFAAERLPLSTKGYPTHSVSHLFSGILLDNVRYQGENIIGLAVDGGPDDVLDPDVYSHFYIGASVSNGGLRTCPIQSPGAIFEVAAERYGLAEGSLMALAAAGRIDVPSDFPLRSFFGPETRHSAQRVLDDLEHHLREQEWPDDPRFSARENFVASVAAGIQEVAYRIVADSVRAVLALDGVDPSTSYLSMSGGVALNCPTNTRLINEFGFRGLLSPPFVNDGGQSVGLALAYLAGDGDEPRKFLYPGPYLGSIRPRFEVGDSTFSEFVEDCSALSLATAVTDIEKGPILWYDDRSESGPRALGHRSILADPRREKSRTELNHIKGRQWWRPVSPVVMEEHQPGWFEKSFRSPYMLQTFAVRANKAHLVPAVVHLDNSARLQTLNREDDERLWDLLEAFNRATGVPMLCNTSLNDKGEPIIETPEQALNFALRKGMKTVYIDGQRMVLYRHGEYTDDAPLARSPYVLGVPHSRVSEYGLSELEMLTVAVLPRLRGAVDGELRDPVRRERLRRKLAKLHASRPELETFVNWRARAKPHV